MSKQIEQIHIRLSKESKEKFKQIADEQGLSENQLGLEAIEYIFSKYCPDKSIPKRYYAYNTNEKVKAIHKDIKSIQNDINRCFSAQILIKQQLEAINSNLSTYSDCKLLEKKMKSISDDLKYVRWFITPINHNDNSDK